MNSVLSDEKPYHRQKTVPRVSPDIATSALARSVRAADIAVGLTHLDTEPMAALFGPDALPDALSRVVPAVDAMNARCGLNTIYLGSIHDVRQEAPNASRS